MKTSINYTYARGKSQGCNVICVSLTGCPNQVSACTCRQALLWSEEFLLQYGALELKLSHRQQLYSSVTSCCRSATSLIEHRKASIKYAKKKVKDVMGSVCA